MKNGKLGDFSAPTEKELAEINKYTRRKFAADELYAFSVVLCDNDVDRDFERFTDEALEKMAELFIGKTGIFDHSHKAQNQCARIFEAHVEAVEGEKTKLGQPYRQLKARAYMPKSDFSEELILAIDSGIKKEVSVGCSMAKSTCSICGEVYGSCQHKKGKTYRKNGTKSVCCFELSNPIDAYEWSFVAVPAQPKAGVVKSYNASKIELFGIEKQVCDGEVTFTVEEAKALYARALSLSKQAEAAGEFLSSRKLGIIKQIAPEAKDGTADLLLKALDSLEPQELFRLYSECQPSEPVGLQLKQPKESVNRVKTNSHFII